jgi:hypothetical protein
MLEASDSELALNMCLESEAEKSLLSLSSTSLVGMFVCLDLAFHLDCYHEPWCLVGWPSTSSHSFSIKMAMFWPQL